MTCKDCIHSEICLEQYSQLNPDTMFNECKKFKNKADFVEVEVLRDWLWKIVLNNVGEDLSIACQDIISRFDGLRSFAKERSAMGQEKRTETHKKRTRALMNDKE